MHNDIHLYKNYGTMILNRPYSTLGIGPQQTRYFLITGPCTVVLSSPQVDPTWPMLLWDRIHKVSGLAPTLVTFVVTSSSPNLAPAQLWPGMKVKTGAAIGSAISRKFCHCPKFK